MKTDLSRIKDTESDTTNSNYSWPPSELIYHFTAVAEKNFEIRLNQISKENHCSKKITDLTSLE